MNAVRLAPGQRLVDRYCIQHFLAAGGMQEVYVCTDEALDRAVVLKTPKGGVKDRRFRRGAEMSARIQHHSVAATFDYYEDDSITFLIEEYVDGVDLGQRLKNEFHFLDPALAAHVIHSVSKALYEAHRVGVFHRDLKPSNIVATNDPGLTTIKLTDFGIAKLAESEIAEEMREFERDESTLTSSNTLLGAVPYMAPECWSDWRGAGPAIDVWAIGCIAYQLLCGTLPFGIGRAAIANVTRVEVTGIVTLQKPQHFGVNQALASLEKEIWDLIVSCVKANPLERPTAREVLDACDRWIYPFAPRIRGVIDSYGIRYANGGISKSGYIHDQANPANRWFFHKSEFVGATRPAVGMGVNFSSYPGQPAPRAAPVLHTK